MALFFGKKIVICPFCSVLALKTNYLTCCLFLYTFAPIKMKKRNLNIVTLLSMSDCYMCCMYSNKQTG